jgi:hypothetical protein
MLIARLGRGDAPRSSASISVTALVGDRILIRQKFKQPDLAAMAGIARENLNRILADWKRRKLVTQISGCYCLESKSALEREGDL